MMPDIQTRRIELPNHDYAVSLSAFCNTKEEVKAMKLQISLPLVGTGVCLETCLPNSWIEKLLESLSSKGMQLSL